MPHCDFKISEETVKKNMRSEFTGFSCDREVWKRGKCILHAEEPGKPIDELSSQTGFGSLIGIKLHDLDLGSEISFHGRDLFRAEIVGCNLENSNFSRASINDALIKGNNFSNADLPDVAFLRSSIISNRFNGADLSRCTFNEAELTDNKLRDADFQGSKFGGVDLSDRNLSGLDFSDGHFEGANLSNSKLTGTNLENAFLRGADLSKTDFGGSNLRCVDFMGADASETHFGGCDLTGAIFYNVSLSSAGMGGTTLKAVNFESADLSTLDLSGLDMRLCNLSDSDLSDSDLCKANLQGSNLESAVLEGTDLRGTNLENTRLFQTYLTNARIDQGTDFGDECIYHSTTKELEKAVWVYRDLQQLLKENSLPGSARKYRIFEKDARNHLEGSTISSIFGNVSKTVWLYGESWKRLLLTSALTITSYSVAYKLNHVGTISTVPTKYSILDYTISVSQFWKESITAVYFSMVTFSTLGYGDVQPSNLIVQILAASEALIGTLLMAALVFVLGRRATW